MSELNHNIISQEQINASVFDVYIPKSSANSEIVYSDSLYNTDNIYTNINSVDTPIGVKKYGIRTVKHSINDKQLINISGLKLTKLNEESTNLDIYAFDNEYNFVVKNELQGSSLYTNYTNTYEWLVDNKRSGLKYTYAIPITSYVNKYIADAENTYTAIDINDNSYTFNIYVTEQLEDNNYSYREVPYNTSTLDNLYIENFVPYNEGVQTNIIYNENKDINGIPYYTQKEYNTNLDFSYVYVKDITLTEHSREYLSTYLSTGDEYYVEIPSTGASKQYISKKIGLNIANDEYFGLTYTAIVDNANISQNDSTHDYFLKINDYEEIKDASTFNKLVDNHINVYEIVSVTGRNSFSDKYINFDTVVVSNDILYENNVGEIIPIYELKSGNSSALINNIKYVNTMQPTLRVYSGKYKANLYYVNNGSTSFVKITDTKYIRNDFSGVKYYVYEINQLNEAQINNCLINDNLHLYGNSYLLYPNYGEKNINGQTLYYSEIDKKTGIFVNNSLKFYTGSQNYIVCTDSSRTSNKKYFVRENIIHDTISLTKSEFGIYLTQHNITEYVIQQCIHKILNKTYKIIDDASNITDPINFFKAHPNYIQCIKTKYFYPEFIDNSGLKKHTNGICYTNIACFNNQKLIMFNTLELSLSKSINAKSYYFYIYKTDNKLLTNKNQFVYADNEQYYIKINSGDETLKLKQLSNLDPPAITYFNQGIAVYTKITSKQRIDYSIDNDVYKIYGHQTGNVFTLYGETYGIYSLTNSGLSGKGYSETIISGDSTITISNAELELVELYHHIIYLDGTLVQEQEQDNNKYANVKPLYLANEFSYVGTGSYHWVQPIYKDKIYEHNGGSYWKHICYNEGHWEEDFIKDEKRLAVSTYVYYDDVNNITTTYTLLPDSKIVSSEIIHPKIQYTSLISYNKSFDYYTYINNSYSYVYDINDKVETYNGKYYGIINNQKIELSKHNIIKENSEYGTYTAQDSYIERNYFTYQKSIQLANAQEPELLSVQLCPATEETFVVYNSDGTTYTTQKYTTALSYYSYEYILKDKPFIVSTTVNQDNEFIVKDVTTISSYTYDLVKTVAETGLTANTHYKAISDNLERGNEVTNNAAEKISYVTKSSFDEFNQNLIENSQKLEKQLSNINITLSALSPLTVGNAVAALSGEENNGLVTEQIVTEDNRHGVIKGTKIRKALDNDDYILVENIKIGDNVVSHNIDNNENYISTVKNIQSNNSVIKLAKLLFENGQHVVIGENTPILTQDGFKSLTGYDGYSELTDNDLIRTFDGYSKIDTIERFDNATLEPLYIIDVIKNGNTENDNFYANNICVHNLNTTYSYSYILSGATKFNVVVDGFSQFNVDLNTTLQKEKQVNISYLNTYLSYLSNNISYAISYAIVGKTPVTVNEEVSYSLNDMLSKTFIHSNDNGDYGLTDIYAAVNHFDDGYIGAPYKSAFIADTAKRLFTSVDYDTDIIDSTETDENGNIISQQKHKNNPYEFAKKAVNRANILWEALVAQKIVPDDDGKVKEKIKKTVQFKLSQLKKTI